MYNAQRKMFLLIYSGFIVINKTRSGIFRKFYYLIFTNDRCMIVIQLYIDVSNCRQSISEPEYSLKKNAPCVNE